KPCSGPGCQARASVAPVGNAAQAGLVGAVPDGVVWIEFNQELAFVGAAHRRQPDRNAAKTGLELTQHDTVDGAIGVILWLAKPVTVLVGAVPGRLEMVLHLIAQPIQGGLDLHGLGA